MNQLTRYADLASETNAMREKLAEQLKPYRGVTPVASVALYYLSQSDGRNCSELCHDLAVTMPRVSELSRVLESYGYIKVKSDRRDRRVNILKITEKGRKVVEALTQSEE